MAPMKTLVLIAWLATLVTHLGLRALNLRHLRQHGAEIPPGFAAAVDGERLRQSASYTLARSRFGMVSSLWGDLLVLVFFFAGLLPLYDRWLAGQGWSFIATGVAFALGLLLARTLLALPFDYWRTFRLEARFGFTTSSLGLWCSDQLKSLLLSLLLLGLLAAASLKLVQASPDHWWLWVWGLLAATSLFLLLISPYLIEPLFFKFQPLQRASLEAGVRELLERAGLKVSKVLQVDASRRSRHSNAYFTGIGRVKRIVLFDTLLEQMDDSEVLAILGHELGHWKHGHLAKRLLLTQLLTLAGCWGAHGLLAAGVLPGLLGLSQASFYAQVLILAFAAEILFFPLSPLFAWFSRRHEWQADRYASKLTGHPQALAAALVKLSRENLSNLHPHPWHSAWYDSHPPVARRVARLLEAP